MYLPGTTWRAFLYGGGSALLLFNLIFLAKAVISGNFVPVVPILAGILTAGGLLLIIFAEHRARLEDKRDHRRLNRVASQLEKPLTSLQIDLHNLIASSDSLPGEARLVIKRMATQSGVLLENIRDVFLTLQAQEGKVSREVRVHDLCELVQEAVRRLQPLASARNVELDARAHCADAPAKVDKRLFLIAVTHIIENGLLYTLTPGQVSVSVTRGPRHVRVIVQDRGIGITDEDADIVFQPFARGRSASHFDPDGIGVGLTLVRLIIREFGGKLTWQPRQGAPGTQFEIQLPLTKT